MPKSVKPSERLAGALLMASGERVKNLWLGTSPVDQETAEESVPDLLRIKGVAAVYWVSVGPVLGYIQMPDSWLPGLQVGMPERLGWIVAEGESNGAEPVKARPTHPNDLRVLRDTAAAFDIPFHLKQWGEWVPREQIAGQAALNATRRINGEYYVKIAAGGSMLFNGQDFPVRYPFAETDEHNGPAMICVGKHRAGRALDGITHDAFPKEGLSDDS